MNEVFDMLGKITNHHHLNDILPKYGHSWCFNLTSTLVSLIYYITDILPKGDCDIVYLCYWQWCRPMHEITFSSDDKPKLLSQVFDKIIVFKQINYYIFIMFINLQTMYVSACVHVSLCCAFTLPVCTCIYICIHATLIGSNMFWASKYELWLNLN